MLGSPGSMTMYSTAVRTGLPAPNDTPSGVGPASYNNTKQISCRPCDMENIAPFLTSSERQALVPNGNPSPAQYYPIKKPRWDVGCPLMRRGRRFPKDPNDIQGSRGVRSDPCCKTTDPWLKMLQECECLASKRRRMKYSKFVSNNVPTVFHPLDLRSFFCGTDGRMYPVRNKDCKSKTPGPIYNTCNIRTDKSPNPRAVDFWHSRGRVPIFPKQPGACPADFTISRRLCTNGGVFLSKTDNPKESGYRLFEFLVCKASKTIYPSPLNHYIKSCFDVMSPKAVSAPFKSRVPRMGIDTDSGSPGPQDYFQVVMTLDDIDPPIYPRNPSYFTFPPEGAPFNCTAERFCDLKLLEEACCLPSPADYDIPSFTDLLYCACKRNIPAICNPKLGFLTSALARPKHAFNFKDDDDDGADDNRQGDGSGDFCFDLEEEPKPWRNTRPRKLKTYPYHGPPPRYPDSPGPIYDTRLGSKVTKSRRDWWDPRRTLDIGFNTSGCSRNIRLTDIDKDIPGPGLYYANKPGKRCMGGNIKTTAARIAPINIMDGPGPRYKIHDKVGSSMWRGSHLGTFNVYLKGVDVQRPCSGGFHPRGPLDKLGDEAACIERPDEYREELCPTSIDAQSLKPNFNRRRQRRY